MFDENFENIIFQNYEKNIIDKEFQNFNTLFYDDLDKSLYGQKLIAIKKSFFSLSDLQRSL